MTQINAPVALALMTDLYADLTATRAQLATVTQLLESERKKHVAELAELKSAAEAPPAEDKRLDQVIPPTGEEDHVTLPA